MLGIEPANNMFAFSALLFLFILQCGVFFILLSKLEKVFLHWSIAGRVGTVTMCDNTYGFNIWILCVGLMEDII